MAREGDLKKVINRWYVFSKPRLQEDLLIISNRIYSPSYISLQWALSYYRLIPEGVYTITAISSLKTQHFNTPIGAFSYRHLKPSLMFGYRLIRHENATYKIAEPEKLILDYLYLTPSVKSLEDLEGLRLNIPELNSLLEKEKLQNYLAMFDNKALERRVKILTSQLLNHA